MPTEVRETINNASKIVNHFEQQPKGPVLLDDLANNEKQLALVSNILDCDNLATRAILTPPITFEINGKNIASVNATGAPIGPNIYIVVMVTKGLAEPHNTGGEYAIHDSNTDIAHKLILKRGEEIDWTGNNSEMEAVGRTYENTHKVMITYSHAPDRMVVLHD